MHIQSSKKLETYYVKFYHGRVVERTRHSTSGTVTMPASVEFDKLTLLKFKTKDMRICLYRLPYTFGIEKVWSLANYQESIMKDQNVGHYTVNHLFPYWLVS